jgi:hypothetical protein
MPGLRAFFIAHSRFTVAVELTGAEIFVRCLKDEGVEYVFGYPGGAALHITTRFINKRM